MKTAILFMLMPAMAWAECQKNDYTCELLTQLLASQNTQIEINRELEPDLRAVLRQYESESRARESALYRGGGPAMPGERLGDLVYLSGIEAMRNAKNPK
jgi:hypothetical protein